MHAYLLCHKYEKGFMFLCCAGVETRLEKKPRDSSKTKALASDQGWFSFYSYFTLKAEYHCMLDINGIMVK